MIGFGSTMFIMVFRLSEFKHCDEFMVMMLDLIAMLYDMQLNGVGWF